MTYLAITYTVRAARADLTIMNGCATVAEAQRIASMRRGAGFTDVQVRHAEGGLVPAAPVEPAPATAAVGAGSAHGRVRKDRTVLIRL